MPHHNSIQQQYFFRMLLSVILCHIVLVNGETTVQKLADTISNLQVKSDTKFSFFPPKWQTQKGAYPNQVKLNFHGELDFYMMREMFNVPDVNMFTSAWVTACLIEAYEYGNAPQPPITQLELALNTMDKFRNLNVQYNNSEMTFWLQTLNTTANYYQSFPTNLMGVLELPDYLPDKMVEEFLDKLGLKDVAHVIKMLLEEK